MALSLRYTGARPYTELRITKHQIMGFSRGMVRDDVPEDLIRNTIMPMIANGATAWEVLGTDSVQAKKMLRTVKEPVAKPKPKLSLKLKPRPKPEPKPKPELEVKTPKPEPKPKPELEVKKVVSPMPAITDKDVNTEILLSSIGFKTSMTRAQMMSWCSGKGIAVNNRSTKASMTDAARAYVTGASE